MDDKERVEIIRKGNELFNNGRINEAVKLFVQTKYHDGIMRVADCYFYDMKQPLVALKFYRMINRKDRIDEIYARMMFAFKKIIQDSPDKGGPVEETGDMEVKVHPKLKILADEIIRDSMEKDK